MTVAICRIQLLGAYRTCELFPSPPGRGSTSSCIARGVSCIARGVREYARINQSALFIRTFSLTPRMSTCVDPLPGGIGIYTSFLSYERERFRRVRRFFKMGVLPVAQGKVQCGRGDGKAINTLFIVKFPFLSDRKFRSDLCRYQCPPGEGRRMFSCAG